MSQHRRDTLEFVVPRIYVTLPTSGSAEVKLAPDDSPVERRLVADLMIFYAFDLETHFQIVAHRDLSRLGVSGDELHDRALANLRALKLEVRAHEGANVIMLVAGGNYEATLILLPEIWKSMASMVSGQIVASVPARDVVFVTGDSTNENLGELRRCTSKAIEHADKPLSRCFLRWNGSSWEKYEGFAE